MEKCIELALVLWEAYVPKSDTHPQLQMLGLLGCMILCGYCHQACCLGSSTPEQALAEYPAHLRMCEGCDTEQVSAIVAVDLFNSKTLAVIILFVFTDCSQTSLPRPICK